MRMQNGDEREFSENDVRRTNILIFTTNIILILVTWLAICWWTESFVQQEWEANRI